MDLHDRLRHARESAGYDSAASAARAFGWNVNTYSSNENGNRAFSRVAAEKYASAFGASLEWLLTGKGTIKGPIQAGGIVDIWDRILPKNREAARRMLEGLAEPDKTEFKKEGE